ncbi:MAG TPA: 50S ribosomal protein L6 [Candidatus Methylomirabilis sp.]|nr:50S ribosomal protein L6 [Candidatus Methylomirabilis sp.]
MSRLGKLPIKVPTDVQVKIEGDLVTVKGPKGELSRKLMPQIAVKLENGELTVKIIDPKNKRENALWGLYWNLLKNMIVGVKDGFEKKLEVNGVGFKVAGSGNKLTLNVGFSHPVIFELPAGISGKVEENIITLTGADKELLGNVANEVRNIKKPEPYKGKGIKYVDEILRRKEGKAAVKSE